MDLASSYADVKLYHNRTAAYLAALVFRGELVRGQRIGAFSYPYLEPERSRSEQIAATFGLLRAQVFASATRHAIATVAIVRGRGGARLLIGA